MRFVEWNDDQDGRPDPERTLERLRLYQAAGMLPWRTTMTAGAPAAEPGELESWLRAVRGFFADLPYRLEEEIGPDPDDAGRSMVRVRVEHADLEGLVADRLRRRPAKPIGGEPGPALKALIRYEHERMAERSELSHVRARVESDDPPRVYTARMSVPPFLRDTIDAWVRRYKEYFAGRPYRLAEETVTEDPDRPGKVTARLRFERLDPDG